MGWGAILSQDLALTGDSYEIEGADVDATTYGVMVASRGSAIGQRYGAALRYDTLIALGAGGEGVQGEFTIDGSGGLLWPLAEVFGPFARVGFGVSFVGNPYIYRSRFELPTLELGLQVLSPDVTIELGAHGGIVLVGRYNPGVDAHRALGADAAGGGRATFQVERFRLDALGLRIWSHRERPGGPVDELHTYACIEPLEALMLCGNADWHRGRVVLPDGSVSESTVAHYGATLAWGGIVVY